MEVLARDEWQTRAATHAERVDAFLAPHLARREKAVKHPVHDFLFTYYSHRPAQLRRWHPGYGVRLADAPEYDGLKGYADGAVTDAHVAAQRPLLESLRALLGATAARPASFGCFGLHEWAMVYRQTQEQTRHNAWPLRLGAEGTDAVVESHRIACSHFDAFRFFTEPARPLNALAPTSRDRVDFEQPGCLHAGMDLYGKVAVRLSPMIPSDLALRSFILAREIRALDMRASPYDLSELPEDEGEDWSPVKIETAEGKRQYAAMQADFAERGRPIRAELIVWCERLLAASNPT